MATQQEINRLIAVVREYQARFREGRDYLMSVDQGLATIEDALYAFGWTRDGMNVRPEYAEALDLVDIIIDALEAEMNGPDERRSA